MFDAFVLGLSYRSIPSIGPMPSWNTGLRGADEEGLMLDDIIAGSSNSLFIS